VRSNPVYHMLEQRLVVATWFTPDYIILGDELLPKVACGLHAPNSKHRHPTLHFCAQRSHFTLVLDTLEPFVDTTTRENTVRQHQHREQQQRTAEKQQQSNTTTEQRAAATGRRSRALSLGPGPLYLLLTSPAVPPLSRPPQPHHQHRPTPAAPPRPRLRPRSYQSAPKQTRWPPNRESCSSSSWGTTS